MSAARSRFALVAGLLLAAAPAIGSAQGWQAAESSGLLTKYGEYVLVGGGVTDFTGDVAKDAFDVGATWDVRVGFGSRFFVGGELAYVGTNLAADGAGSDLMSNGAEAVVRVQYPYVTKGWLVEPFAFGGIGWSNLSLDDPPAPGLKDSDDVGVVPFGAGLTAAYGHLLLDARFTYRTTFDEDLALSAGQGPASLERWAVGASVGYEF